jgi:BREX system ATP-binding protein BrxC/D
MDLMARITDYLLDHPASKAREIAAAVSAERSDVNRILYVERGRCFEVNSEYQWSLLNGAQSLPAAQKDATYRESQPNAFSSEERRQARAVLARLKRGVPPDGDISALAVGMEHLQQLLSDLLDGESAPRWRVITGEYGEGKTFFRMMSYGQALNAGYAVASFDVNRDDGALHQPQRHLCVFLNTLRSPLPSLRGHQGILDIFRQWIAISPRRQVIAVLKRLQNVPVPIGNVHDSAQVSWLVDRVIAQAEVASNDLCSCLPLLRLALLISCVDLVGRSSQARFSAAYRLQLVVEWLTATGHKGLLLFIDELDNIVRQIHGKAHPACFRTLAWYCSATQLKTLRVIAAMTPEMVDRISAIWRESYGSSLDSQQTVRIEECTVYHQWNREAAALSANEWAHCPALSARERMELFRRILSLHAVAWGTHLNSLDGLVEPLAKSTEFRNTRRWVRASVSILDILQQHPDRRLIKNQ